MAYAQANGVRFTANAGGTTDWVNAAAVTGFNSPSLGGMVNGKTYVFRAESADLLQWELAAGVYTSASGTLARTTVLQNSSGTGTLSGQSGAGTKISFTLAPTVTVTTTREDLVGPAEAITFTATEKSQARTNIGADFETGTVTLFYQTAAPTGWTKVTTQNDKALRVVSGSGGVSGGTNAFSTVMAQTVVGSTTISTSTMPSHNHTVGGGASPGFYYGVPGGGAAQQVGGSGAGSTTSTDLAGSSGSHNHTITMAIQYIDIILASKN